MQTNSPRGDGETEVPEDPAFPVGVSEAAGLDDGVTRGARRTRRGLGGCGHHLPPWSCAVMPLCHASTRFSTNAKTLLRR